MGGWRCWAAGTGWRPDGTGRWRPPRSGATSCWPSTNSGCSASLSVFPAPFTLEAAEAVAGEAAARRCCGWWSARCWSRRGPGPDGRPRYAMLETLRGYGAGLLAEAGEQDQAQAALARYAVRVAGQAAAGMPTIAGEPAAARWLDAEDATMGHVLGWAVEHDLDTAARLVTALGLWWVLRGRLAGQEPLLRELAGRAEPGSDGWCAAQFWLAWTAFDAADLPAGAAAVRRGRGRDRGPGAIPVLADCLALQSVTLANLGRVPEAAGCGRRALAMARELGYPFGQALATTGLVIAALYAGDLDDAVQLARQAGQIPDIPGTAARVCGYLLAALLAEAGDLAAAEQACAATLAQARDAGDLYALGVLLPVMADLDLRAGRPGDAAAHLREAAQIALQTGIWLDDAERPGRLRAPVRRDRAARRRDHRMGRRGHARQQGGLAWQTRICAAGRTPCARPGRRSARTGPARPGSAARR